MTVLNLVEDLIHRTERSLEAVAKLAVDTGITFTVDDVTRHVEDHLPAAYPLPTVGTETRADMIRRIAADALSGDLYQEAEA